MNEEIIIINDEPFYRILNGTSYDYAPIPKEFKPYFEKLQQKNQQLKKENTSLRTRIKTIKRIRKKQTKKKNKYKLQIIEIQNSNQQLKQKYLNAIADYESEKSKNQRAINKIDNMFNNGDEYTIIDDLIELDKILKGENNE